MTLETRAGQVEEAERRGAHNTNPGKPSRLWPAMAGDGRWARRGRTRHPIQSRQHHQRRLEDQRQYCTDRHFTGVEAGIMTTTTFAGVTAAGATPSPAHSAISAAASAAYNATGRSMARRPYSARCSATKIEQFRTIRAGDMHRQAGNGLQRRGEYIRQRRLRPCRATAKECTNPSMSSAAVRHRVRQRSGRHAPRGCGGSLSDRGIDIFGFTLTPSGTVRLGSASQAESDRTMQRPHYR